MGKTKTAFVGQEDKDRKKPSSVKASEGKKIHIAGLKGGQRIKAVVAEPISEEQPPLAKATQGQAKKTKKQKVRGKKYNHVKIKIDRNKLYPIADAIKLIKSVHFAKFDETVELHLVVKKTNLTFNVTLPHPSGKVKRIEIADDKTLKKIEAGKIDFDILLAYAEMMPRLIPFAKVLGPRGLMPNPKNATLIKNPKEAEKFSGNNITLKTEKEAPLIHAVVGRLNMQDSKLVENTEAILRAIGDKQLVKAYMKSTMSPSIKLDLS